MNGGAARPPWTHEPGRLGPAVPQGRGRDIRRVLTGWLAMEFGAAVLAIAIVVALGPVVVVLLLGPGNPWLAMGAILSISGPVAAFLGGSALKLSWELLRQARFG
jgi:hypothetical protein